MSCDYEKYANDPDNTDEEAGFYPMDEEDWYQIAERGYLDDIASELTAKFGKYNVEINRRPYDGDALAIINNSFDFAGHDIRCKISVRLYAGYYEGFTLDWELDEILSRYDDMYPTEKDCADHLEADIYFYSTGNKGGLSKGLAKMLAPKLLKRLTDQINETTTAIESILDSIAPHKLAGCCLSNGEGFYSEVA